MRVASAQGDNPSGSDRELHGIVLAQPPRSKTTMTVPDPETRSRSSQRLQQIYSRGYFHGETSGYPETGYGASHPDWEPWIEFLRLLKPTGVLVDLGCAYGHLVHLARQTGYTSFGLDVSSYALEQYAPARPCLVQGHLQQLPFRSQSADLVTLFDVLEHVLDPIQCLRESARILKPDGVLAGATPDPRFFHREEETHWFERPPSFWLDLLDSLNFQVRFRFSEQPYNFQFVATAKGSSSSAGLEVFAHDYFSKIPDFVSTDSSMEAVPRDGWGPLIRGCRLLKHSPASVYLLNPEERPLRLSISCQIGSSSDFGRLRIRLDSHVLKQLFLSSERDRHSVQLPAVLVPSGGHHLFFEQFPQGPAVEISDLRIDATPSSGSQLVLGLPFDLYQRYRLAGQIAAALKPDSILDVGGYLGDQDGHLASSQDFFSQSGPQGGTISIQTTDIRHCDHPRHSPAAAWNQPFADGAFDLLISLDVLEHLPLARRSDFLTELDRLSRRWILLGAPFASAQIQKAERELSQGLMQASTFLKEHEELGLPEAEMVERFFGQEKKFEVLRFPNGLLSRWKAMQVLTQHYFGLNDYLTVDSFNRLYNHICYPLDQAEPAYRTVFLICKEPLVPQAREQLKALLSPSLRELGLVEQLAENPSFLELHERLRDLGERQNRALDDVSFLINERQTWIRLLQQDLALVKEELRNLPLWKLALRRFRQKRRSSEQ